MKRTRDVRAYISRTSPVCIRYTLLDLGTALELQEGDVFFPGIDMKLYVVYRPNIGSVLVPDEDPALILHSSKVPIAVGRERISLCDLPGLVIKELLDCAEQWPNDLSNVQEALEEAMVIKAFRGDFVRVSEA